MSRYEINVSKYSGKGVSYITHNFCTKCDLWYSPKEMLRCPEHDRLMRRSARFNKNAKSKVYVRKIEG